MFEKFMLQISDNEYLIKFYFYKEDGINSNIPNIISFCINIRQQRIFSIFIKLAIFYL